MKIFLLRSIYSLGLALPVWGIEHFYFGNSNLPIALVSFLLIWIVSLFMIFNDEIGSMEQTVGLAMMVFLYAIYGVHHWFAYAIVVGLLVLISLICMFIVFGEDIRNRKRDKILKEIYPLKGRELNEEEKEVLCSLYGENGHYYKVIQSGALSERDAEAINAKIRRVINIKQP
ncbi:hypothetical protein CVD28_03250 [Bacillus sp. M6-12]|uniref:hypothetical protein n=1 Tax=Bacillus sp. M6-12 TaxID=2054166 RepID=UPI000C785508|nr:hypothetical protein [Bacillus sp. M6-12]PLS19446.1 hypothetical protein CVD28_03250 [Bacillus sp. M6-12]